MKFIKFKGIGTGPAMASPLLTTTYDFSASTVYEMPDADANLLLTRCGRNFEEVSPAVEAYVTARTADAIAPAVATRTIVGDTLTITYTEAGGTDGVGAALHTKEKAAPTDFAVLVNSAANVVKYLTVVAKTVTLKLTTAVVHGDTVTVAYTQQVSGVNQIKDLAGNKAIDFTAASVTNNTVDVAIPVIDTAEITADRLVITYTDTSNLDATNKALPAAFAVVIDGSPVVVNTNTVHAANKTVTLAMASAATAGHVVTCSYTPGTGLNSTRDAAGNIAAGFTDMEVTNSTT